MITHQLARTDDLPDKFSGWRDNPQTTPEAIIGFCSVTYGVTFPARER